MYLVFDVETTGLPKSNRAPITDHDNWPRVVQLAWVEYDDKGEKTGAFDFIIKPDGFYIPQEAIAIHRITNERANEEGKPIGEALDEFQKALSRSKYAIAHNIKFDENVLGCEYSRVGKVSPLVGMTKVDTMTISKDYVKARGRGGRIKMPRLEELHEKLFGVKFDNAHDALADVQATGRCFFKLQELGVIGFGLGEYESKSFASENFESTDPEGMVKPLACLGVHTFHSILQGAGSVEDYVEIAKEKGHDTLGITDRGSMSGTFEFYLACQEAGIKPVIGAEILVNDNIGDFEDKADEGSNYVQKVIIKNEQGYRNLNKLIYMSHTDGFNGRESRVKTDWIIENKEGLILIASGHESMISGFLSKGMFDKASSYFKKMLKAFGKDFYGEIRLNEKDEQRRFNEFILSTAPSLEVQITIDNDVHYPDRKGALLQDTVLAIGQKVPIKKARLFDRQNLFYPSRKDYFDLNKSLNYYYPEDALSVFMDNTLEVAKKCDFHFEIGKEKYPKFEAPKDIEQYFHTTETKGIIYKLAQGKLKKKLKEKADRGSMALTKELVDKYFSRLKYELDVIDSKKMLDYFLVNWELIRDYRSKGHTIGPARGSAAGSLLSWALDITNVDPIKHGLYFERFLNPTRNSPPDIDIDFETDTDDVTDDFLISKYGKDRVLSVGTWLTFNERGCIKDVVRAHRGQEATSRESDIFQLTKEMPKFDEVKYDLKHWIENWPKEKGCSPTVKRWLTDPENKIIIDQTLKLQGQVRGIGQHAAGVVITPEECWKDIPTNMIANKKSVVTAFREADGSVKELSKLGILKLDRLKLSTLNIIKEAIKVIKERKGIDVKPLIDNIDECFDDPNIFEEIKMGQNHGVFQFESPGMNALVRGINPETFEELAAANALYRPAAMSVNAHTEFIHNKFNPNNIKYAHDALKPILSKTNGVMLFQEQVMFIANEIGGLDLGEGDMLRRYMDKASKIIEKNSKGEELSEKEKNDFNYKGFLKYWNQFLKGASDKGLSEKDVNKIRDYMIKYLGYSFNACLSKNTFVKNENGVSTNILDVKVGDKIVGYNTKDRKDEAVKIVDIHHNGEKEVFKITTKSGKEIECTMDHKILTKTGMKTLREILDNNIQVKVL